MRGAGVNRQVRSDYSLRLTADLNSSYSPAVVARHDAMLDEVAIAAPFRIVAAEAGRVAAPGAETAPGAASGHHRWLNQAGSRQCEHGYNRFPHRASLHSVTPEEYNTFAAGLFRRSNIVRGKLTVSRQSRDK
jgi:hypothetical protein